MKSILISLFIIGWVFEAKSQQYFANYMIIGTSLTYMRNSEKDYYKTDFGYDEYTWNLNVGIQISKRVFTGLQLLNIYSSQITAPKDYFNIYGLFTQYNVLKSETHRLFAEVSFNRGNYCTCNDIPYYFNNLYYIGFGVGYDLPIKKIPNLYFDFSFINYSIINKIYDKYGYTQYIVGINYRLNER